MNEAKRNVNAFEVSKLCYHVNDRKNSNDLMTQSDKN